MVVSGVSLSKTQAELESLSKSLEIKQLVEIA